MVTKLIFYKQPDEFSWLARLDNFVNAGGAHLLIEIFTKTDIANIDNFLKLKVSHQILQFTCLFLKW